MLFSERDCTRRKKESAVKFLSIPSNVSVPDIGPEILANTLEAKRL
jgi:hypothetical protein